MIGPGLYDSECTLMRETTQAESVILIVVRGWNGSGFSVQTTDKQFADKLPGLLRTIADQIEIDKDIENDLKAGLPDTLESGPV